jgi:hypothetical protein
VVCVCVCVCVNVCNVILPRGVAHLSNGPGSHLTDIQFKLQPETGFPD